MTDSELLGLVVTELVDSHQALRMALTEFAKLGPLTTKLEAAVDAYRKKTDSDMVNATRVVFGDEVAADMEKKGY